MVNFINVFSTLIKSASKSGGYPYQIKAADLDQNFVFAALDADDTLIEKTTGQGGHPARKLKIPPIVENSVKTYVLGTVKGELKWIPTEEC